MEELDFYIEAGQETMEGAIKHLNIELSKIRAGKASTGRLDGLMIEYYGMLTEERRRDLVKRVKQEIETAKINIRNARQDANNNIKKLKGEGVSEDAIKMSEEKIQKITDAFIQKIDQIFTDKEKDIMSV